MAGLSSAVGRLHDLNSNSISSRHSMSIDILLMAFDGFCILDGYCMKLNLKSMTSGVKKCLYLAGRDGLSTRRSTASTTPTLCRIAATAWLIDFNLAQIQFGHRIHDEMAQVILGNPDQFKAK